MEEDRPEFRRVRKMKYIAAKRVFGDLDYAVAEAIIEQIGGVKDGYLAISNCGDSIYSAGGQPARSGCNLSVCSSRSRERGARF